MRRVYKYSKQSIIQGRRATRKVYNVVDRVHGRKRLWNSHDCRWDGLVFSVSVCGRVPILRAGKEEVFLYLTLCTECQALNAAAFISPSLSPPLHTHQKSSQTSLEHVGHCQKGNCLLLGFCVFYSITISA